MNMRTGHPHKVKGKESRDIKTQHGENHHAWSIQTQSLIFYHPSTPQEWSPSGPEGLGNENGWSQIESLAKMAIDK